MEQVKLYCAGVCRGEITLRPEGGRTEVLAVMPDPGDGLYRVELLGERGGLMLGVMEPAGRELTVCRRLYSRDVTAPAGGKPAVPLSCSGAAFCTAA